MSDSESEHDDEHKSLMVRFRQMREEVRGYDSKAAEFYQKLESDHEEEIEEEEEDVVFDIIEAAVEEVAEIVKQKDEYVLFFDEEFEEEDLDECIDLDMFDVSSDNIPYLTNPLDLLSFVKVLAQNKPVTRGHILNIDDKFKLKIEV